MQPEMLPWWNAGMMHESCHFFRTYGGMLEFYLQAVMKLPECLNATMLEYQNATHWNTRKLSVMVEYLLESCNAVMSKLPACLNARMLKTGTLEN